MISTTKRGRRIYFNAPFSFKDTLKEAGCKWDPAERKWWLGSTKQEVAEELVAAGNQSSTNNNHEEQLNPKSPLIQGRASYQGKSYHLLLKGTSARTGRPYAKLAFMDGSRVFWASNPMAVTVLTQYPDPRTIEDLRNDDPQIVVNKVRPPRTAYECGCYCHDEYKAGAPGSILFDGCDRCGCEAC